MNGSKFKIVYIQLLRVAFELTMCCRRYGGFMRFLICRYCVRSFRIYVYCILFYVNRSIEQLDGIEHHHQTHDNTQPYSHRISIYIYFGFEK